MKAMMLEGTPLHAAAYIGDRGLIELLRQPLGMQLWPVDRLTRVDPRWLILLSRADHKIVKHITEAPHHLNSNPH